MEKNGYGSYCLHDNISNRSSQDENSSITSTCSMKPKGIVMGKGGKAYIIFLPCNLLMINFTVTLKVGTLAKYRV